MSDSRYVAMKILYQVLCKGGYSALVLNTAVKESELSKQDSSFVSALVYGVLERKLTLDYIIKQYSKIPLRKIEDKTKIILYLGIYQLLFMDKVPESAAVNESVKLAKKARLSKSAGFINAVLRNITRAQTMYTLPDEKNKLLYLSVKYSCPQNLIEMWLKSYGEEITLNILDSLCGRPPLTVRVNTLKTTKEELIAELSNEGVIAYESDICGTALIIENTGSIERLKAFKDGKMYVQDIASQLCTLALSPQKGETLLDVCSAPGGKSFSSAMLMQNDGKIHACDIYEHKLSLINKTAKKLGINIIDTRLRDALGDDSEKISADKIICDVPCSGFGIIRRKPEIRYKKDFNLQELADIQYKILCNSAKFLKPGGILIYSTCTLNPVENSENARRFLKEHADFKPSPVVLPDNVLRGINEEENEFTLFPHLNKTDGFFISAFRRVLK